MKPQTTRRDFFKVTSGAATAAGFVSTAIIEKSVGSSAAEKLREESHGKIEVNHEWGTLKEVICGIPELKFPTHLTKNSYNSTPADGLKWFEANKGKSLKDASPEIFQLMHQQMEAAVKILQERGVIVHRPDEWTNDEAAYLDSVMPACILPAWCRDPVLVIGNNVIETECQMPWRRRERFAIRRALAKRLANSNARHVSMPPATPVQEEENGDLGPGPFLDGGDVFVIGKDIYVGVSGNASNRAGIDWLQQYLGNSYTVHEVKLTKSMLHLDCALATPKPGLAIACREGFAEGLPAFLKGWKIIDVPLKDAKEKLACNGLVLDEETILMSAETPYLTKALRDMGHRVIENPFHAVYQWGGAYRCWHHPLVRESVM